VRHLRGSNQNLKTVAIGAASDRVDLPRPLLRKGEADQRVMQDDDDNGDDRDSLYIRIKLYFLYFRGSRGDSITRPQRQIPNLIPSLHSHLSLLP